MASSTRALLQLRSLCVVDHGYIYYQSKARRRTAVWRNLLWKKFGVVVINSKGNIHVGVWLTLLFDHIGICLALPLLPKLIEELVHGNVGVAAFNYGILLAVSGLILFFFSPIQGALSDRVGRKKMLAIATGGTALSFVGLALAPNLPMLLLAQILNAASGASYPVAGSYVADKSNAEDRAKNFGTFGAMLTLGFILGPAIGGLLGHFGLRLAMGVAAVFATITLLMVLAFFEESRGEDQRDPLAWKTANPFAAMQLLFARPALSHLSIVVVCSDLAFQFFISTWVLYTTFRFNWSIAQAGASLAFLGLGSVLVQAVFLRFFLARFGTNKTLMGALLFDAAALLLYNCVGDSMWMIGCVITLHCLGSAVKPTVKSALSLAMSSNEQGALQGALASQFALSSVVGGLLGTALFGYFTSPQAPATLPGASFLLGFLSLIIAAAIVLLAGPKTKPVPAVSVFR
jgi:MFS transporter, DHA1 family, tetracycline resistance protein